MSASRPGVAVNLTGVVETARLPPHGFSVDRDGRPYLPAASAGVVLGLRLGDGVFSHDADHAAPGVTLAHPDPAARHALTAFCCLGNEVTVRDGEAAGARGRVLGKRGEAGRVIAVFAQPVLARLAPGDSMVVRGYGQGMPAPVAGVSMLNLDPAMLGALPITVAGDRLAVSARGRVPSSLVGNGLGRPAQMWDLDVQLDAEQAARHGLAGLSLGDLVCVDGLDARHNAGYRGRWVTIATVVHAGSPAPGHGPGLMPVLCGPIEAFELSLGPADHVGVTERNLGVADG